MGYLNDNFEMQHRITFNFDLIARKSDIAALWTRKAHRCNVLGDFGFRLVKSIIFKLAAYFF